MRESGGNNETMHTCMSFKFLPPCFAPALCAAIIDGYLILSSQSEHHIFHMPFAHCAMGDTYHTVIS